MAVQMSYAIGGFDRIMAKSIWSRALSLNSIVLSACILMGLQIQSSSAACPQPPVSCESEGCSVTNYRGKWEDENPCKAAKAFFPKTESDLINAVAYAVKERSKIKVVSGGSHSLNRFACPGGKNGVVISTRDYNSRIMVDEEAMTVTADAGVELRKLLNTLAAKGFAFPHTTDWDGLSVSGVISTGAHGSGLWKRGSALHEYVVGISLVIPASPHHGYAKLIRLTEKDEDLKAVRLSLGVLGAISQVTFAVEKMFKRSVTMKLKDDFDLEDTFESFAAAHEFGIITWHPSFHLVTYMLADRVALNVAGNGTLSNPGFAPVTVQSAVQTRINEEENYPMANSSRFCKTVKNQVKQGVITGKGFLNDGKAFKSYPVVGYNHLMQSSSGCEICNNVHQKELKANDTVCAWDTRIRGNFYSHTSIYIPLSRIGNAIKDMKQIRDMYRTYLCNMDNYLGVKMRYFKRSKDYLSRGEDSVDVDIMYMRFREAGVPRWNEPALDEMEQMLLHKYNGVPHWGKNRVYTFEGAAKRTVNLDKFLEVKKQMDPEGFFSSEWSDGVLGIGRGVQIWRDGCALDGYCVCKEDRHCAPHKGFLCRRGRVWKQASVCRQEVVGN